MSRIHKNHSLVDNHAALGGAIETAVEPLRNLVQAIAHWHPLNRLGEMIAVARARRDLRDLDDRMLLDIGVTRLDVDRESRRRFWDTEERRED